MTESAPQILPDEGGPPVFAERGGAAYGRISLALFLAGFATFSLLYCVQPLLPEFSAEFDVGAAQASLALSLSTGALAWAVMAAGALSQQVGRRGLMFASMAAAAAFNLATAAAPNWGVLLMARALEGFVLGGVPAIAMAYLAEEVDPRSLGLAMGVYVGGTAFGGMIGRVGMGVLTEFGSWRAALAVIGAVDLAAALGFVWLLPKSRNFVRQTRFDAGFHLRAWAEHLKNPRLPYLFAAGFLAMGAFVSVYNYAGFRLTAPPYNLTQTQLGLIFAVYLIGVVASSSAGHLADRFGRGRLLALGFLLMALGIGLSLARPLAAVIGGVALLTAGFFVAHSVASGWVGRLAKGAKGHASSLYLLAYYVGSSVLGSAGGWFWSSHGWPGVAAFAGAAAAAGLVCAWAAGRGEARAVTA